MSLRREALPSRLVIVAGTYDGVLAGWETTTQRDDSDPSLLKLTFATPVHEGSTRGVCMAASADADFPGTLLTCGYDEMLKTHDWKKRMTSSGGIRTPADFGTPSCVSFCPPNTPPSTHCLVGFAQGKLVLYKKRDWSIQHVFAGHEHGVASVAVHPSGKMALTGGTRDGKIKLWDLTKGRLAYSDMVVTSDRQQRNAVESLVFSPDGQAYGWCSGNSVRVRSVDTSSGDDLVSVELPIRVNQITLMEGPQGLFVATACNDGSLPVLMCSSQKEDKTVRAVMAIEPVDRVVAGEERFKCIHSVSNYLVVTANSAGVISVMDLSGAVGMILQDDDDESSEDNFNATEPEEEDDHDDGDDEEEELAVDIIESVRLGTGARITSVAVWSSEDDEQPVDEHQEEPKQKQLSETKTGAKRKAHPIVAEMDDQELERARALVQQAKKVKKQKEKKKAKKKKKSKAP